MNGRIINLLPFFIMAIILFSSDIAYAKKSDRLKPKWLTQTLPESKSGTYMFVRSHGQGRTLAGAKQMAFVSMSQKLEVERGLTVTTDVKVSEELSYSGSSSGSDYRQEITLNVVESGRKLEIVCREIDDYWVLKGDVYEVDVLYTVTDKSSYGGSYDDEISITTRYGAAGFLSVIPGGGQFYKGSVAKGSLILAGSVAAAGGIILCENTRASYIKKMIEQPKYAAEYNALADRWETGRNVCIGAAAAIYVYNLIDAFLSDGAKRVVVRSNRVKVTPYADSKSMGLSLAFNF